MKTKNIEKEFRIEVIASLLENRFLKNDKINYVSEYEIYELCSFVSGVDVDSRNLYRLGNKIKSLILKMHPELNIRINRTQDHLYEINFLYDVDINAIISAYRSAFGDTYKIKSINKCLVKTLELQD